MTNFWYTIFPLKMKERKGKKVAKPVFNHFFVDQKKIPFCDPLILGLRELRRLTIDDMLLGQELRLDR